MIFLILVPACRPAARCMSLIDQKNISSAICKQANVAFGLYCGDHIKANLGTVVH